MTTEDSNDKGIENPRFRERREDIEMQKRIKSNTEEMMADLQPQIAENEKHAQLVADLGFAGKDDLMQELYDCQEEYFGNMVDIVMRCCKAGVTMEALQLETGLSRQVLHQMKMGAEPGKLTDL